MTEDNVRFTWDGEPVDAIEGEPVAAALWRAGTRIQTRSIKFHRARGPQCMTGDCPGCMVRVDGVPNVRGCREPVREGLEVTSQVGRPDAERDVFAVIDRVFEHFDHERSFVKPRLVREIYQAVARRMAGFGTQPTGTVDVTEGHHLTPDVLVAGGGPAGLAAAHAARQAGAEVLAVDEAGFGGRLRYTEREVHAGEHHGTGQALVEALAPPDQARLDGTVVGVWDEHAAVAADTPDGLAVHTVDPDALVIANGAIEGPALVDGNDRPGVLGARAARILATRWGVEPGDPVAVVDAGREGRAFARAARERGVTVREVEAAQRVLGDPTVTGVETSKGILEAEAVVVDPGLTPAPELGRQAGVPYVYEAALGGRIPLHDPDGSTPMPGVYVSGSAAGLHTAEAALVQGRWAGRAAAGAEAKPERQRLLDGGGLTGEEREAVERVWRRP